MDLNKLCLRLGKQADAALLYLATAIIAYLVIAAWFDPFRFTVFAGDDLRLFDSAQKGFRTVSQLMTSVYRFRPVTALADSKIAQWTRCDFHEIASIGVAIHALNAVLFFLLLYRAIRLPLVTSIGVTALAILNRFTTYLFLQEEAIMEGVGIVTLLAILAVSLLFIKRPTIGRSLLLALLFLLIIDIHERYLVLAGPLVFIAICALNSSRKSGIVLVGGIILSVLANFCVKRFLLGIPILVGAATVKIGFNMSEISSFFWHGVLNLIGINRGPNYLSLEAFEASPLWVRSVSVGAAVFSCLLLVKIFRSVFSAHRRNKAAVVQFCFYLFTIGLLLLSASITIRQEYRWLYPAFLAFLLFVSFGVQLSGGAGHWPHLALTCLTLLSISREIYLARWHSRFFAVQAYQVANNFFDTVRHVSGIDHKDSILIRGNVPVHKWIFMENTFSHFYRLPPLDFSDQGSAVEQSGVDVLVVKYNNADCSFTIIQNEALPRFESYRMDYSALSPAAAAFPSNKRLATPTKTPLFTMSDHGVACMVAVSPVEVSVPIPPRASVLHVCFSHVYAIGDGVDIEISAQLPSGPMRLLSRSVPPLATNDFPVWRKYEFPLPQAARQVHLHVFSKSGRSQADWIALRDFSFN